MPYIGKSPNGTGVRSRFYYTATGGETSLSGADDNSRTLSFSDGNYVDVSLNGIALVAGTDYNTSTANTIAGLSALSAGDVVEVIVYDLFTIADTVSAKDGGGFGGNVSIGGTLSVTGAATLSGGISNLIRIQTFTADSTYTRATGATKALVYVIGGGGGGGGVDGQGSGKSAAGAGGGAGGMATKLITSGLGATETVTVGLGGAGGTAGANAGSTGGTSSFGSHCSATGGTGGVGQSGVTPSNASMRPGGLGGVGTGGDINTKGQSGEYSIVGGTGTSEGISGGGGSTMFGSGALGLQGDQAGNSADDATQAGGGGSGACSTNTSTNYAGGDGANGIVVVYEYL